MACKYFIDGKQLSEQELKSYVSDKYIDSKDIKFTTLDDIANILAYSNSKIILDGWKIEYSTPLGNKYDTLEEVNNEIRGLVDANVEVDLSGVKIPESTDIKDVKDIPVDNFVGVDGRLYEKQKDGWKLIRDKVENGEIKRYYEPQSDKNIIYQYNNKDGWFDGSDFTRQGIEGFIEKNKEYEQSKEIIEQWKKENNIKYDPEEVYSRGQGFYSSIGAYSNLELDLLLKNLIQHIQDNKKAGGEFTISAFTKPIGKRLKHIEGTGDRVRFVIYPKSEHIKWAAPTDVYSGSVWDAHEKVSKDKKSELLGVSFTKAPSLRNINEVSPNLADIIDNLSHAHNELGIELTTNNFRIEYDDNIDYSTKKLIDNINKILDDKYGKLVKPEIKKSERKQVGYSLILDFNDGEISIIEDFKTEEEANNALIENRKIQTREDLEQGYELKVLPKIEQGKQPTQTKENTTSIESVRDKVGIDKHIFMPNTTKEEQIKELEQAIKFVEEDIESGRHTLESFKKDNGNESLDDFKKRILKDIELIKNQPEYTSQAEINLKVAALKEVARKYPRSLITSKVVPINPNLVDNSEIQYSKVGSKQDIKNNTKPKVVDIEDIISYEGVKGDYKSEINRRALNEPTDSDVFHYPFSEVYDELDQSEPTGEFEDTFDSEFETNSKKLDKIILNRYLKIQKSLERQKDKLVSEFNKIENTNDFTKDAEIYFDKHKELISEINIVEEKLKRIKAVVDAIFDKKDITSVVIAESNLIIDDINKLLKSENISPAELDYYYNLTKLLEEIHDENLKQEDSSLFTNASSEDLNQLKKLKNTFSNLNNDLLELLRKNINIKNDPIKDAKLFSQWFLKIGDYTNDILKKAESMISKSLFNITKFLNKELEAIKELHLKADSDFKRTGKQNNKFDIFFDKNKRIVQVFNYEYTDAAAKLYNAFRFASKDSAKSKRLELIRFHKQHSILLNAKYLFPDIYEHLTGTKVSAEEINKNIALYKSYLDDYTFEKMKSKVYKQTIKYLSKRDNDFFMSNMPFDENSLIQEFLTYIPKDKSNYNDKYSKIVQNDNLRNVYDKFMDLFNELKLISQGTTRSNLNKGFLPFLEKTMIENLSDFSFSTELGKFKQSILSSYDQLKNNSGQTVSNQVENPLKTVNDGLRSFLETKANDYYKQEKINLIYFLAHKKLTTNSAKLITEKFGPGFPSKKAEEIIESWTKEYFTSLEDTQTNDIQVLMNLMAQTVTSYKQKQAIESNLNLIKIAFDNQAVGEFDILGNLVGTNPTKKGRETKLAELLEVTINHFFGKNIQKPQLNDFLKRINNVSVAKQEELNKLVKEINENKELTPNEKIELEKALQNKFKKDSKYVDLDKINDKLLQGLRILFLGWSPKSAFFNAAMGHIGNYMETIDGRIVDSKDLSAGVKMLFGKEKKKIQKLIANLSLIEDITKDFKKTTEESLHNEKWKNFKPERLQQIVEKSNQSPLIAALLNKSFNGVRIIDMIDESGNFLPQYEEYEYKFVNTAKYLIEKVHGPYDSNRIIMAETTSLGKNVIFMKKWMITSFFMKRFGSFDEKPREDLLMDYQFKGTYITLADVFNTMSNDQSGQRNYLLGIMKTMKAIALSDQSLTEVDKANLRSVRADLLIIGALLIAQQLVKYMLSDDDDDHEGLVFLLNTFFRIETELGSHYFLIDTFEGLAKNTIPQLDVYNRLEKIIKSFNENARISPAIRLAQMVPVLNSGVSLYNFFNQQILYNR